MRSAVADHVSLPQAHQAHESGNGAEAHALSQEGQKHKAAAEALNTQASEYIFRENNAGNRVSGDTIDLHGQFVEEAENILEARIRQAKAENQTHLHVIVGKGNHSPGHVQKIKPRVEQVCRELGLQYHTEPNAGRIYVDLTGGSIDYSLPPPGQAPQKYQGGYGQQEQQHQQPQYQQGHPQYQQQQQFHPQQPYGQQAPYGQQTPAWGPGPYANQGQPQQQFQEENAKQDDGLTACLKKCCIVM